MALQARGGCLKHVISHKCSLVFTALQHFLVAPIARQIQLVNFCENIHFGPSAAKMFMQESAGLIIKMNKAVIARPDVSLI